PRSLHFTPTPATSRSQPSLPALWGFAHRAFPLWRDRGKRRAGMRKPSAKKKPEPSSRATARSEGRLPAAPEPRSVSLLWWLAVILTCWSFGFTTMQDTDLWWHLAGGR